MYYRRPNVHKAGLPTAVIILFHPVPIARSLSCHRIYWLHISA